MNVPLATAVPVAQFQVQVPHNVTAGQQIQTQTPDGQTVNVQVPPGVPPGGVFFASYTPVAQAPIAPMAAPMQQGMGGVMVQPTQLQYWPGAQDPYAILSTLSGVTIKQQIRWGEVLVGWSQAEKYLISDPVHNRDLFVAGERTDGLMGMLGRQAFEGGQRPFNVDLALLTGAGNAPEPFVHLERPFKCTCLCFQRPRMNIYNVHQSKRELIASTEEPFSCCHLRIGMNDQYEQEHLKVDHHCCDCSLMCWGCPCGCQETTFQVFAGGEVVGHIKRQFNAAQAVGLMTGVNADSDQFYVDFQQVQDPKWKAALIGMALFLDYCYFVKGGQSARESSAAGRLNQFMRDNN